MLSKPSLRVSLTNSVALWDKGMFGYNYPDAAVMSNLPDEY